MLNLATDPGAASGAPGSGSYPGPARLPGARSGSGRQAAPGGRAAGGRPLTGILVAGAHGGAGTSTLAALLRADLAARQQDGGPGVPVRELPALPDGDPAAIAARTALPGPVRGQLILAARGNPEGIRRAVVAVTALECLGVRPAALAVTGDGAGPLPRAAAQRLSLLGNRAGLVVEVPFAAALRAAADPAHARVPGRLLRAVTELADLTFLVGAGAAR